MIAPFPLPSVAGRRLVLASGSPRRRELLGLLGIDFDVVPADVDEAPWPGESPIAMVVRLAADKARAVADTQDEATVVIAADTTVDVAGEVVGKPADASDAARILASLSGRTHQVHTAVAVVGPNTLRTGSTTSEVTFAPMSTAEIEWYVATGEPLDKAGAYGLQGIGGTFVTSVTGSVTGVLGLPMDVVVGCLRDLVVIRPGPRDG